MRTTRARSMNQPSTWAATLMIGVLLIGGMAPPAGAQDEAAQGSSSLRMQDSQLLLTLEEAISIALLDKAADELVYQVSAGVGSEEIAGLRQTREKTVRQQASNIYAKSGLEGRHALAACFLEDVVFCGETSASEGRAGAGTSPGIAADR